VDIQEDKPPLKLPYNITDDPWMAAHDFLENNGISQMYLDQVVKFIQEQTKGISLGSAQQPSVSDPFTGQCLLCFSQYAANECVCNISRRCTLPAMGGS